jgi:hypothetical protein
MNGLLKNQFYGAFGGAVVLLVFFSAVGIGLLITGNPTMLNIFALAAATAFAFNTAANFRKEASSKWNKYELTAPVRRSDIVKSRYVSHVIWAFSGMFLSALFVVLTVAIHGNRYFYHTIRDPLTLFSVGIGVALLMGTIFYPMIYLFGADKSEITMIISLPGAVGITVGVMWLFNAAYDFKPVTDYIFYINMAIYLVIVIISFVLSYFLTTFIFRRTEC